MGSILDSSEKPRFNLFHRNKKTLTLPTGEKIPIVKDINSFAADMVAEEIKKTQREQIQQPVTERRPLVRIKSMLAGLTGSTVK